jgi:hypothetical protein
MVKMTDSARLECIVVKKSDSTLDCVVVKNIRLSMSEMCHAKKVRFSIAGMCCSQNRQIQHGRNVLW